MRVETSRLIPGCVLSESILGKTSYPLIAENTVLTEEHIEILNAFIIDAVHISNRDVDGNILNLPQAKKEAVAQNVSLPQKREAAKPFSVRYNEVIKSYRRIFSSWSNNMPIDMPTLRQLFIPLIECLEKEEIDIYHLHTYSEQEDYFYHHDVSVGIISAYLAKQMGFEKGNWIQVGIAGFLSNCGMAKIDVQNINRPGPLSETEYEQVKKHSVHSYRLIEDVVTITDAVKLAVLQHHERLDGSGYPLALERSKIHKYARIIAVSDTYHAMTSDRPYQAKQTPRAVITDMQENQTTTLDAEVIQVLANHYQN